MRNDVILVVIVTLLMYISVAFIVNAGTDSGVVVAGACVAAVASLVPSLVTVKMLLGDDHATTSNGMALAMLVGILATVALGAFAIVYPGNGEYGWAVAATATSAAAGVAAAAAWYQHM